MPRSCAKEFRHLGWAPLFYHNPVSQAGTYSRSAGQLQVFVQAYHTPSSVRQQRFNCYHTRFYHTPKHTLCGCSGVLSHPLLITPLIYHTPNTPCGCSDVLSHPLAYHPSLGPPASCTLSPGVDKITPPPTPGDNIFKSQNVITGVCCLVSVTVRRRLVCSSLPRRRVQDVIHQYSCGIIVSYCKG